jgi:chromate reductase
MAYQVGVMVGSLRRESFNRQLAELAMKVAPVELQMTLLPIGDLPFYNQDLDERLPEMVVGLKAAVEGLDGVLLVTPEYNRSIPALLKNAVDWISRPEGQNSWAGKPAGIMGASNGQFATIQAQYDLRKVLTHAGVLVMPQPQVLVPKAQNKLIDGEWDDKTRQKVTEFMAALTVWVSRFAD